MIDPNELNDMTLSSIMNNMDIEDVEDPNLLALSVYEAFDKFLNWYGIIGYTGMIINTLDDIRRRVMNVKTIAEAVLKAVKLREESYDHERADAASEAMRKAEEAFRAQNPDSIFYGGVDYKLFYTVTLEEACDQVAPEGLGKLIYLALDGWWNDTIEWAEQIVDPQLHQPRCQHGVLWEEVCEICNQKAT